MNVKLAGRSHREHQAVQYVDAPIEPKLSMEPLISLSSNSDARMVFILQFMLAGQGLTPEDCLSLRNLSITRVTRRGAPGCIYVC